MWAVIAGHATDLWGVVLVTFGVLAGLAFYADSLGPAGHYGRLGLGDLLGWGTVPGSSGRHRGRSAPPGGAARRRGGPHRTRTGPRRHRGHAHPSGHCRTGVAGRRIPGTRTTRPPTSPRPADGWGRSSATRSGLRSAVSGRSPCWWPSWWWPWCCSPGCRSARPPAGSCAPPAGAPRWPGADLTRSPRTASTTTTNRPIRSVAPSRPPEVAGRPPGGRSRARSHHRRPRTGPGPGGAHPAGQGVAAGDEARAHGGRLAAPPGHVVEARQAPYRRRTGSRCRRGGPGRRPLGPRCRHPSGRPHRRAHRHPVRARARGRA